MVCGPSLDSGTRKLSPNGIWGKVENLGSGVLGGSFLGFWSGEAVQKKRKGKSKLDTLCKTMITAEESLIRIRGFRTFLGFNFVTFSSLKQPRYPYHTHTQTHTCQ